MFNSKAKELEKQLKEAQAFIAKYNHLFTEYDSVCEAIADKKAERDTLEREVVSLQATIADNKRELSNLYGEKIAEIYNADIVYREYFGDYISSDYATEIADMKHIISCENSNIKSDIANSKIHKHYFPNDYVEINRDKVLKCHEVTRLYDVITNLIALCIHLKCDSLAKEIRINSIKSVYDKAYKFKKHIEDMFKVIDLKIDNAIFDCDFNKFSALHNILVLKEEQKEKKKREAQLIREQEALARELEEKEKELNKELEAANEDKTEIIKKELENIKSRKRNTHSGWVYVIDCDDMIDNCFKIGITRRLDWSKRIDELSDASHSFKFNVRGVVWSEDVFKLEADMHRYFADKRLNQNNYHKEHFICTLDEIEAAFKSFGYDVKLDRDVVNYDYLDSIKILKENGINLLTNG